MTNQIQFSKPGEWVMRITADRRIEVNDGITVTEAAQTVLEAVQKLLEQPEQKPLTEEEIRRMKPISPDLVDFRSGVRCAEAAHGIKGEA